MTDNTIIDNTQAASTFPSARNIAIKWAIVGILLHIIQTILNLYLNDGSYEPRSGGVINIIVSFIISFTPIIMAIKEYRDNALDGFISFGKAFKTGFTMSLYLVLFTLIFYIIFYNLIIDFDVFMSEQMDKGIEAMKKSGLSDEAIKKRMGQSGGVFTKQWFSLSMIVVAGLFFQSIIILIVAAILKRNRPENA